jgi:hypothetical protein
MAYARIHEVGRESGGYDSRMDAIIRLPLDIWR